MLSRIVTQKKEVDRLALTLPLLDYFGQPGPVRIAPQLCGAAKTGYFLQQETSAMSPFTNMSKKLPLPMRIVTRPQLPRAPRRRFLPRLDLMEDRTLLSTLTVMNNHDSGSGSLRADIAAAHSGDTIAFAYGLRGQTITLTTGELDITTSLQINGLGASRLSVSGGGASRVFDISQNATVAIANLTITDGKTVGDYGGGILVEAGSVLSLNQVAMTNNQAMADSTGLVGGCGGGIENGGTLYVNNSAFTDNVASLGSNIIGSQGGGINSFGPSVTNSVFTGNQADGLSTAQAFGTGGAINTDGSAAIISNSTFIANLALGRTVNGGAICIAGQQPGAGDLYMGNTTITNSTFTGNQAIAANGTNDFTNQFGGQSLGGAIFTNSPVTIANSGFTDNLAKGGDQGNNSSGVTDNNTNGFVGLASGGGVISQFGTLSITSSYFVGNQAIGGNSAVGVGGPVGGGGIANAGFSTATLTNVILESNQARGGSGGPGSAGGSSLGGGFYNGIDSTATVSTTLFLGNRAVGGAGGSGATGGVGEGGAIANGGGFGDLVLVANNLGLDTSSLTLGQSTLIFNVASGGNGGAGGNGGDGSGGALFADPDTTTAISSSWLALNQATGGQAGLGGLSGDGFAGAIDVITGASVSLKKTNVAANNASTSNNDILGTVTYL
jgi:hypothetical protein